MGGNLLSSTWLAFRCKTERNFVDCREKIDSISPSGSFHRKAAAFDLQFVNARMSMACDCSVNARRVHSLTSS